MADTINGKIETTAGYSPVNIADGREDQMADMLVERLKRLETLGVSPDGIDPQLVQKAIFSTYMELRRMGYSMEARAIMGEPVYSQKPDSPGNNYRK